MLLRFPTWKTSNPRPTRFFTVQIRRKIVLQVKNTFGIYWKMRSMSLLLFVCLMSAMGSTADPQLSLKFKLANGGSRPEADMVERGRSQFLQFLFNGKIPMRMFQNHPIVSCQQNPGKLRPWAPNPISGFHGFQQYILAIGVALHHWDCRFWRIV